MFLVHQSRSELVDRDYPFEMHRLFYPMRMYRHIDCLRSPPKILWINNITIIEMMRHNMKWDRPGERDGTGQDLRNSIDSRVSFTQIHSPPSSIHWNWRLLFIECVAYYSTT